MEYQVKLNSDKSHITADSNACIVPRSDFVMNGTITPLHNYVTHLGHYNGNTECQTSIIDKGIRKFN